MQPGDVRLLDQIDSQTYFGRIAFKRIELYDGVIGIEQWSGVGDPASDDDRQAVDIVAIEIDAIPEAIAALMTIYIRARAARSESSR